MSQENVDSYVAMAEAFNARDWDAFLAFADQSIEVESRLVAMEGPYRGHEGLRRWWENFVDAFPDYRIEIEETRDLGDITLCHIRGRGHGAGSKTPVIDPFWQVGRWRNGKCVWWHNCSTEAEALEAAGLPSQENVEIVRRLIAAWNNQEVEGMLALTDPEVAYINAPAAVEPGTRSGHDEFIAVARSQWESLPGARWEIDRLCDRHDEVISVGRVSRAMPGGDARIENPILVSWRFRDGKVIQVEMLGGGANFHRALEAAGLSE